MTHVTLEIFKKDMSGHSKWATTKRQKAVTDARRASVFTKLANAITIAARDKGGDITTNFSLRLAVEKAKTANMPKDNIERAIQRGAGGVGASHLEEIAYEAFGPEGVGIFVMVLTDNRNRSASDVKRILSKYGGSLGSQNSVSRLFERKGVIGISSALSEEQELALIEAGAEDIMRTDEGVTIQTPPADFEQVKKLCDTMGLSLSFAEYDLLSAVHTECSNDTHHQIGCLTEELEDLTDVTDVFTTI